MFDVLITEDDPAALHLTLKALKMANDQIRTHITRNGAEAIAFLKHEGPYADAPTPNLIVLDWNLPKVHGREVPAAAHASEDTKNIPIVVVTTSNADSDRNEAASLGVNQYVVKAPHFSDFAASVREFTERYLGQN